MNCLRTLKYSLNCCVFDLPAALLSFFVNATKTETVNFNELFESLVYKYYKYLSKVMNLNE